MNGEEIARFVDTVWDHLPSMIAGSGYLVAEGAFNAAGDEMYQKGRSLLQRLMQMMGRNNGLSPTLDRALLVSALTEAIAKSDGVAAAYVYAERAARRWQEAGGQGTVKGVKGGVLQNNGSSGPSLQIVNSHAPVTNHNNSGGVTYNYGIQQRP